MTPSPVSTTYPTNAAKIFKWGNAQWVDEFSRPVEVDVGGQPEEPGAQPARHAHPRGPGDRWRHRREADWSCSSVRPVGSSRPRPQLRHVRDGVPRGLGAHARPATTTAAPATSCSATTQLGTNRAAMHVRKLPNRDFTVSKPLGADQQPVPHLRHRGHSRPHLVVRRHQGDQDRATIHCPDRRHLRRALPAGGQPRAQDDPRPDADGLGSLLHAGPTQREADHRTPAAPSARSPAPADRQLTGRPRRLRPAGRGSAGAPGLVRRACRRRRSPSRRPRPAAACRGAAAWPWR